MKIKDGGNTEILKNKKIETIRIGLTDNNRSYELWINEDSLSYLSIEEMLDLKEEINMALESLLLCCK